MRLPRQASTRLRIDLTTVIRLDDTAGRIHATISQCSDMQHFIKSQCGNSDFFCLRFHTVLKYHLSINTLHPSPWTRSAASRRNSGYTETTIPFAKSSDFTEIWRNIYQMFCQIKYFYLVLAKHLTSYATHRKETEVAELEHRNAYSGAVTNQITMDALFE